MSVSSSCLITLPVWGCQVCSTRLAGAPRVELLPVWDGTNCAAASERVRRLIDDKRAEIATRIADLQRFAAQLDDARAALGTPTFLEACRTDLSCCVPPGPTQLIPLELVSFRQRRRRRQ
jgi:hypothetical protein